MNKYKIKDSQKIMGLIKVFEEQSINVKAEKEIKKIVNKVIFISIGVCIISEIIKKMPILNFIFLLLGVGGIIAYMMKQFSTILYKYTKDLGGKKYKIFSKENLPCPFFERLIVHVLNGIISYSLLSLTKSKKAFSCSVLNGNLFLVSFTISAIE